MKRKFSAKKLLLAALVSALVLTVSFAQTATGKRTGKPATDTVPKKEKQIRDLDDALSELDKGEAEMQKALKEFDGDKLSREIHEAMKGLNVDMAKMKEEMARTVKEIDVQKINAEVQKGLADAQKNLAQIDVEKIKAEVQASLSKIDMDKMKVELEKIKEIDVEKIKKEMEGIRPQIEKSLQAAKKDIENARQEITAYKELVNALDKDGFLKKDTNYKVEYKNGQLIVNGKTLSAGETKKYNEFLNGKKDFTLQRDEEGMNIHNK